MSFLGFTWKKALFLRSEFEHFGEREADYHGVLDYSIFLLAWIQQIYTAEVHSGKFVAFLASEVPKHLSVHKQSTIVVVESASGLQIEDLSFLAELVESCGLG